MRHDWPFDRLQDGKPLPKGLTAEPVPQTDGVYELRDTCARCGKVRWRLTLPRGVYDVGAQWSYIEPPDWVKLSQDLEITKSDIRAEVLARNAARLFRQESAKVVDFRGA
jgi:hypothetical protein